MITAIEIENFKGIGARIRVPLKPITLLFGANSSGKSSIIHGLLWAHEANRTGNPDIHRTQIGGESVDLGGFRQFLHRHDRNREVEWAVEIDPCRNQEEIAGDLDGQTLRIASSIGIKRSEGPVGRESEPTITSFNVRVGQTPLLRAEFASDLTFHTSGIVGLEIKEFNERHPLIQRAIELRSRSFDMFDRSPARTPQRKIPKLAAYLRDVRLRGGGLTPSLSKPIASASALRRLAKFSKEVVEPVLFAIHEILSMAHSALESELNQLSYLGPIRSYPSRHPALDPGSDANWTAGGGSAYALAAGDKVVRDAVNAWLENQLETPYRVEVEYLLTERALQKALGKRVPKSRRLFSEDLDASLRDVWRRDRVLSLVDKRTDTSVSHRDVGIGISQVLPVLVSAYASRNRIVAIEQPEIHLHPALQAKLADIFIDSALGERKNSFILETHSEHLILRLLRRIRETTEDRLQGARPLRPDDVSVLYVEPGDKGVKVSPLRIDETGEFIDRWPKGFFAERVQELF